MIRRVAMLSAHTSPLAQPGHGDAGGMNVYVLELARQLARRDVAVEIFTRATSRHQPDVVETEPGILVRHVPAGPFEGLQKNDLPSQMCSFVRDVLRTEVEQGPQWFDVVHSHYWLSGQVGTVASERWSVPLVHTMHTMAKVKNALLADGDVAEPSGRIAGEEEIVRLADRLIANTADERDQLVELYEADPSLVEVVAPGVDLQVFRAGRREEARAALGLPPDAAVLLFAGRIQPLKAPDVVLHAAARLLADDPTLRDRLVVPVIGGESGTGMDRPGELARLTAELGLDDVVRLVPTLPQAELARWYAAASVVCVPSYNESFGLVAIEAQACGTPVVAARVGGLRTAVSDGVSGILVDGHDPADYAAALGPLLTDDALRDEMGAKAVVHAEGFGWDATAERTLAVYEAAIAARRMHGPP
ncbi:UDP-N-acetylglucosamine: 1L-myo-inositol-1-phosphate 1-alpha-D-N-acetylglucosaminyltransferase [Aeromicrobium marinum DSM 15272]|uniref:D-inositol-3-phosphate glycosyltransferase n=1 Tax=Aeromicrobium marinum DSM 15272 TaxID=585531 RepID=E2S7K5_9ACTN|nr:D-inositol-3-phosphate glycosyltransferase [Aeromicrobium marinum]EFQ84671.1 UDP-N-acetylglucosamine: 1L-myo-inositol-1-phosphate 1-alpha-D-N-acetylglucosaminyltransferase [Aeromicrobium marinum DSM 15272]